MPGAAHPVHGPLHAHGLHPQPLTRGIQPQAEQVQRGFLFQAYDLPASAFAAVRLASDFTHLGGARVGPYLFEARPSDPSATGTALSSLCTEAQFLDNAGDPLPFGEQDPPPVEATAVREELTAIVIREPAAMERGFGCPWPKRRPQPPRGP